MKRLKMNLKKDWFLSSKLSFVYPSKQKHFGLAPKRKVVYLSGEPQGK